jgi:hypothetical protein
MVVMAVVSLGVAVADAVFRTTCFVVILVVFVSVSHELLLRIKRQRHLARHGWPWIWQPFISLKASARSWELLPSYQEALAEQGDTVPNAKVAGPYELLKITLYRIERELEHGTTPEIRDSKQ